jgi:hemolysin D
MSSAELTTVKPNLPAIRPVRLLPQLGDREFLPAAIEIVETPPSPAKTALMFVICAFAAAVLAWCWFGRIDIYATARGKIEPAGHAKVVQPLDSGKVAAIKAKEGQSVRAGDVILVLDASESEAEIAADTQARTAKLAEAMRRDAALSAVAAQSISISPAIPWSDDVPQATRVREEDVLAGDLHELSATLANLASQKVEKEAAVKQLEASIAAENRVVETLNERVSMRQQLIDKSVGTRTGLLDAVQVLRQEQSQIAGDIGKRDQAVAAVASLVSERARTVETFVADNTRKMADARRIAEEKEADRAKAQVKLDRATLRAPVDGVVQALAVTTLGQVVTPGQELMRILPSNTPVEVQAFVTNEDIGFVRPGQAAVLKIDSFPFTRYGTLDATVQDVASDAIPAETANRTLSDSTKEGDTSARNLTPTAPPMTDLVFETKLKPGADSLKVNDREIALSPGMTVTVEIKTGSRRILEYLFSPLVEVAGKAMRER